MNIEKIVEQEVNIAVVSSDDVVIKDVSSALELIMSAKYEADAERVAISKAAVAEDFFILSSGLAGEVLQKFITYQVKLAIFGDYSRYTSKPLHDFIYESNCGKDIFFLDSKESAVKKLSSV